MKMSQSVVLMIFDCCFAGALVNVRVGYPHRNFEFLPAIGDSTSTPIPGPRSFTPALI